MTAKTYNRIKPTTIKEELEEIRMSNNGLLDPIMIVQYAEDRATLLHNKFEWDDSVAGEQYRIWQARQIIRLELSIVDNNNGGVKTRTYISLLADRRTENDRGYRLIDDVLSDDNFKEQLLEEARRDMNLFRLKYKLLKELAEVFSAMEKV